MPALKERVLQAASATSSLNSVPLNIACVFLLAYLVTVLARRSESVDLPAGSGTTAVGYMSPEWLRVPLLRRFDPTWLTLHYAAGIVLVACAMTQKALLPLMCRGTHRKTSRWLHARVFGPLTVIAVVAMATGGFMMRHDPDVPHFTTAMVAFVAPWVAFLAVVWPSASLGAWRLHAIAGEALVKACIAVPLARVLGAGLQRLDRSAVETVFEVAWPMQWVAGRFFNFETSAVDALAFDDVSGYYTGIAMSALVTATWAVADIISFWRRCG